jgi:hypothetical protein
MIYVFDYHHARKPCGVYENQRRTQVELLGRERKKVIRLGICIVQHPFEQHPARLIVFPGHDHHPNSFSKR